MHAMPVTQPELRFAPGHPALVVRTALLEVPTANSSAVATTEVNRWLLFLAFPFVLSALFFMATISTGQLWLIGGALVTGPGLLIMAFIYLALSSDSNGDQ
jgi:hypothetical protein